MIRILKAAGAAAMMAVLAACASTKGPDVTDTSSTGQTTGVGTPSGFAPGSQGDLENNVGHRVYFAYNEYTLTPEAKGVLARQAAFLKEYPEARVLVAGNCDERGTREYNLALGARRAEAARSYLQSLGIDGARVRTVSYGKERPIDSRSTEDAWSINRNATTTLVDGASS